MTAARPKRVLALSGGGVRGIIEVAFLEAVEEALASRYGPELRLCDHFDLVGGTSTGALIATSIALGHPLSRARDIYLNRAFRFFGRRRWWSLGSVPLLDADALHHEIAQDVGTHTLGSAALQTYLAIVTKRLDTGSAWVLSNLPESPYFDDPPDGSYVGNRHYRLSQLLRAATAAPTLFAQQQITIGKGQRGVFVDGGLSPYNDPSLALLMLARLGCFGLRWPMGADRLFVLSVGAGRFRRRMPTATAARLGPLRLAYASLMGMIDDTEVHSLSMMEWLGTSKRPTLINSELGTLEADSLGQEPAFTYLRLDLSLEGQDIAALDPSIGPRELRLLRRMDDPAAIPMLYALAKAHIAAEYAPGELLDAMTPASL